MTENFTLAAAAGAAGALICTLVGLRLSSFRRVLWHSASAWSKAPPVKATFVLATMTMAALAILSAALPTDQSLSGAGARTGEPGDQAPTSMRALLAAAPGAQPRPAGSPAVIENRPVPTAAVQTESAALKSLRDFARRIEDKRARISQIGGDADAHADSDGLPDVDTMMSRLRQRLATSPDDLKGWMTLGWAYANTGNFRDAIGAYETALKLEPSNREIKSALDAVQGKATAANKLFE